MSSLPRDDAQSSPFQLFKDLPPAVEAALLASIDRFGVLVPVVKDQHGNVLDGHQRARLAERLGLKYPVNIIEVADEDEALEIARTLNEDRRAMPKKERLPVVRALREEGHSLRAIAGAVGVDPKTIRNDLAGGEVSPPATSRGLDGKSYPARKAPKLPEAEALEQAATINRQRIQERRERHQEMARESTPLPSIGEPTFRVVYADPPWQYGQSGLVSADWGMAEDHYPTMSMEELKSLPVSNMTLPDAVLFMWATSPFLDDAICVMDAWGFKYKSSIVWDKGRPLLGSYVHTSHEFLLIGTRGSCTADERYTKGSVFAYQRSDHSRKPEEFRQLIDSMYTYGNRIELFRRGVAPEGWHVWGNEASDG